MNCRSTGKHSRCFVLLLTAVLSCFFSAHNGRCEQQEKADLKKLNLTEAISYALEHNRSLQNTRLGLSSTEMSVMSAESNFDLKIIPVGSIGFDSDEENPWRAGATLSKSFPIGADVSVTPSVSETDNETTTDVAFSLHMPLLRGAGKEFVMSDVFSSRYNYETAKLSYYSQQISTILQTVSSVYATIRTSLLIELLEKQLKMLQGHLALTRIKERSGVISAIDLFRAEIRLNDVENELTSVREQHADNLDSVKDVLGIPQRGQVVLTAPLEFKPIVIDSEEALNIAQQNRIEIEKSKSAVLENQRMLAVAKNNLLPQLDIRIGYNLFGEDIFEDLTEEGWSITFGADTDVLRSAEKIAYSQQQLQVRQSQLDLESSKENVNRQVRSELNSLEKQQTRIDLTKEQVNQTIGKLRLAQSKFEHGMTDNFVLIEAQTELQEAQTNYLFERINYINGIYRLRGALGTLLDRSSSN